jgi:hypothetical protein
MNKVPAPRCKKCHEALPHVWWVPSVKYCPNCGRKVPVRK